MDTSSGKTGITALARGADHDLLLCALVCTWPSLVEKCTAVYFVFRNFCMRVCLCSSGRPRCSRAGAGPHASSPCNKSERDCFLHSSLNSSIPRELAYFPLAMRTLLPATATGTAIPATWMNAAYRFKYTKCTSHSREYAGKYTCCCYECVVPI